MFRSIIVSLTCGVVLVSALAAAADDAKEQKEIRVGMIGIDTPHAVDFTKIMNDPQATDARAGVTVVAAYVGGYDDSPESVAFRKQCVPQIKELGVKIVPTIDELLAQVDVVMIQTLHGHTHLAEAKQVIAAGKTLYIDKPLAGSLADCVEIAETAKQAGVPWFSDSSLRFASGIRAFREGKNKDAIGDVMGCDAWGPNSPLEPKTMPDLFYYGIHGTEILFTIMGTGCKTVTRVHGEGGDMPVGTDVVVGVWGDGRVGTFRSANGFGATVFGTKGTMPSGGYTGYDPLVVEIAQFFKTGKPPVSPEEILEVYAFMAAADVSKNQGGTPVSIESVLNEAKKEVSERMAK